MKFLGKITTKKRKKAYLIFYPSPDHSTNTFIGPLLMYKTITPDVAFLEMVKDEEFEKAINEFLRTRKDEYVMDLIEISQKFILEREIITYLICLPGIVKKEIVFIDKNLEENKKFIDKFLRNEMTEEEINKKRDEIMANRIFEYLQNEKYKNLMCSVLIGAGHLEGILRHLSEKMRGEEKFQITGVELYNTSTFRYEYFDSLDKALKFVEELPYIFNTKKLKKELNDTSS